MRSLRFLFFAAATAGLILVLNTKQGNIPAIGPLLSPATGCWQHAEGDKPPVMGRHRMPALNSRVEIIYDERRVPHVFAESLEDMVFAQGYVTAVERLWQMEFQVLAAAGRLSEIFGPDFEAPGDGLVLRRDRLQRRQGMLLGAENAMEAIAADEEMMALLEAYSAGVNARIDELSPRDYPMEYKLLGYGPEAWTPIKSALLVKYMTQTLTGYENDVEYTNMLAQLGRPLFEQLFPDGAGNLSPIVETPWDFEPVRVDTPDAPVQVMAATAAYGNESMCIPQIDPPVKVRRNLGSNNWAVSGAHTASGNPILANDPHLMLNLPSLWYEVQLSAAGVNVYGVSLPGAPGVILGFNGDIAWGVTNAGRDVKDWYRLRFRDEKRDAYYFEGSWRAIDNRIERFDLADGGTFIDTIRFTHHGLIVYDGDLGAAGYENLAMNWEMHHPSLEMRTFFDLNRARNHADYRAAISYFQCPGQNFIFASREGDIAITQQGHFPALWPEQGRYVMDGSQAVNDWQAYIPFEQNPYQRNPERGFVSSANQFGADSLYPYYQHGGEFEKYRNRRINGRLATAVQTGSVDHTTMKALQLDNFNYLASEALPPMMAALGERDSPEWRLLTEWNRFNDAEAEAPSVFSLWFDALDRLIWDEIEALEGPTVKPEPFHAINLMRESPEHPVFDRTATQDRESLSDLCAMAWDSMCAALAERDVDGESRDWASVKGTSILHLINSLEAFSAIDLDCGGDKYIVNATSDRWGPSWRMVVEMSDPPKAWGVYPGGQSGNPGSPAYDAFIDSWASGRYYELHRYESLEAARAAEGLGQLVLQPGDSSPEAEPR